MAAPLQAEPFYRRMNSTASPGDFVDKWLAGLKERLPDSQTVAALSKTTHSGRLDEIHLLKLLRELRGRQGEKDQNDEG